MNKLDKMMGKIIDNYTFFFVVFILLILIIKFIIHRKKITYEYKCPFCETNNSERISRDLFTKLIYFNVTVKKFKCLKCWKIYYVKETFKNEI